MWEKLLPWIGGVFAVIGLILIFFDVIASIKRRDKAKTNVVGLVLLSVAVVGYVITDIILKDSAWPPFASLIWIALFWVYVILDVFVTMGTIKKVRREKRNAQSISDDTPTPSTDGQAQSALAAPSQEQSQQDAAAPTTKKRKK